MSFLYFSGKLINTAGIKQIERQFVENHKPLQYGITVNNVEWEWFDCKEKLNKRWIIIKESLGIEKYEC